MSTATLSPGVAGARLSGGGILRSEWIKLRSLRSTVWSYLIVIVMSLGIALLMGATFPGTDLPASEHAAVATQAATAGMLFGELVVVVLGVLVISGEYSTGMIRSTLSAVPRRLGALWAKAVVLFVATFVVGLASTLGGFLIAAPALARQGIEATLFDEGVLGALAGGALYLALIAVLSLGLGTILRNGAGGIAAAFGLVLVLPIVLQLIPAQWAADIAPYTPMNAGGLLFALDTGGDAMTAWQGGLVLLAWVAVTMVVAAVQLKRRDA